jgi:hypothetical protein
MTTALLIVIALLLVANLVGVEVFVKLLFYLIAGTLVLVIACLILLGVFWLFYEGAVWAFKKLDELPKREQKDVIGLVLFILMVAITWWDLKFKKFTRDGKHVQITKTDQHKQ